MEERERKLTMETGAPLPEPASLFADLGAWTDEAVEQVATYFDTTDLRLTRAGASLRFRSDDGWTVKTPITFGADEVRRDEHTFAGSADARPAPAEELVLGWSRNASLDPVARVTTHRRRLRLADAGTPLAEVTDDRVEAEAVGAPPCSFREIEIELGPGADPQILATLAGRVRAAGAHEEPDGARSKVARALGPPALAPPDVADPGELRHGATLAALVEHAIRSSVALLIQHDHVVRIGEDPEGVHQARVATRRLRSDLHTFAVLLDPAWVDGLRAELKWLGTLLGRVRDADVLLERLEQHGDRLPAPDRAGIPALADRLRATRARDRIELLDAMTSPRYLELLDRLVDAADVPPFVGDEVRRRARWRAPELARRPWEHLRRSVRALPDDPSDEQLHEVRKKAKRARYALEAIAPVTDGDVRRLAERVSRIQDALGEHHDAVVATAWLRDAAADTGDPGVAFAAGALAGTFGQDAQRERKHWRRQWRQARARAKRVF